MTISSGIRIKALVAIAVAIAIYVLATSGSDAGGDVNTASQTPTPTPDSDRSTRADRQPTALPAARELLARLANRVSSRGPADSLFVRHSWYVPPPPPPPAPVAEVKPPPPTAPPLPFGVMGSYTRPGDATVYFLTREERVFDVHVGDTIDGTYKVDGAASGRLLLTYLPLNIQQSLAIGGAP
jgi:hypothetical protein